MKTLNIKQASLGRAQSGFTIIELVVVILLLGILTATALPRFMDVSDEAHGAVVDGVRGSMQAGIAMYYAQYTAEGEDSTDVGYGSGTLDASAAGYPQKTLTASTAIGGADCEAVYEGIMQVGGRPIMVSSEAVLTGGSAADIETAIEGAAANTDFIAISDDADDPGVCSYYYIGQYTSGESGGAGKGPNRSIPVLQYNTATGVIVEASFTLQVDNP